MSWADWLNLESLILVSRAIVAASEARQESRGGHYREDFPEKKANSDELIIRNAYVNLDGSRFEEMLS
jgi:fumarate reductase flavoprotein subunit